MRIQLSEHFTFGKLLRFSMPSVIMMVFTSVYSVVDGLFVSNFVGKTPFAALNLIYPVIMVLGAFGFMIGTGGSAIVAKTLGEGKKELANAYFSMLIYFTIITGILLTAIALPLLRPIAIALGAEGEMTGLCVLYGGILSLAITAFMLQNVFQSFLITAEKPKTGLVVMIAAGVTNIVLDFVFIAVFRWGLAGAAAATALSQFVGGFVPVIYFMLKNTSLLHLTRTKFYGRALLKACTNGSSELMTNISMSVVTILYNFQLMTVAGEDGISAYGVIMYINFIFVAIFLGYALSCAPVISYHYGAGNHSELKSLFKKSLTLNALVGIAMLVLAEVLSVPMTRIFVGYDAGLEALTCHGLRLYALSFLLCGFNIFGSAFFTALNNGAVSAAISFLRTLVFQIAAVLILPLFLDLDGIWLAIVAAEIMSFIVTVIFFVLKRKTYHYA